MFINGITVLSQTVSSTLGLSIFISVLLGCLIGFWWLQKGRDVWWKIAIPIIVVGIISFFCCGISTKWTYKEKTEYKVTIDDSVNWNDVYKLYDIKDVDGEIVTLTIKEQKRND